MEFVAVAVIAASVVGIVIRSRWEKRADRPVPDGEAVGGWFGGVRD